MKLKVFVPKDGIGNEKSQCSPAYDPFPTETGGAGEADGGMNPRQLCPTFCCCPGIPRPLPGVAGPADPAAAAVITCSPSLRTHYVLSIPPLVTPFLLAAVRFIPLDRREN